MPVGERDWQFRMLEEHKQKEKEAYEKAAAEAAKNNAVATPPRKSALRGRG